MLEVEGIACTAALRQDCGWRVGGAERRPCGWSGVSKGERVSGEEMGQMVQGLVGCGDGLGLLPRRRWEPWRAVGRGGTGPRT